MSVYEEIVSRKPVEKGWSGDKKYCATAKNGKKSIVGTLGELSDGVVTIDTPDGEVALKREEISKLTTLFFDN